MWSGTITVHSDPVLVQLAVSFTTHVCDVPSHECKNHTELRRPG